jgi:hypothetical protein
MHSSELFTVTGLCVILGATAFVVWAGFNPAARQDPRAMHDDTRVGERLDRFMATLWGGSLLLQLGSILRHVSSTDTFNMSWLSLAGFASVIFMCGGFACRLLLRVELRRYREKREARVSATRA